MTIDELVRELRKFCDDVCGCDGVCTQRQAADALERLKAERDASEERFEEVWNHAKDLEGKLVTARNLLAQTVERAEAAEKTLATYRKLYGAERIFPGEYGSTGGSGE